MSILSFLVSTLVAVRSSCCPLLPLSSPLTVFSSRAPLSFLRHGTYHIIPCHNDISYKTTTFPTHDAIFLRTTTIPIHDDISYQRRHFLLTTTFPTIHDDISYNSRQHFLLTTTFPTHDDVSYSRRHFLLFPPLFFLTLLPVSS